MQAFKRIKLGQALTFQRGFDITKAEQTHGSIPIVSSSGVSSYHNVAKVNSPGVIIGRKGTLGTVHAVNTPFWPHDTTLWVKDFKGNDPRFLYYFLKTLHLENFDTGSSNPTLNRNHLHKIEVVFPVDVDVQRKIAGILSAYDDLIENNRRRIAILERMAEELYREWFVRMRFPGYQNTKFIKGVPEGWEVKPLKSILAEIKSGIKKSELSNETLYVGLEHIPRHSLLLNDWSTGDSVDSNKLRFESRDILFSKIRPYLHKIVLAHVPGACSTDTIVLRPRKRSQEGFALMTVSSDTFVELATIASKGTKMPRADWGFLKEQNIPIPSDACLELFQNRFDVLFMQMVKLLQSNDLLNQAKCIKLNRLISGRVNVEKLKIQLPSGMASKDRLNDASCSEELAHA
ncbi:MAG: restriction endonuclease subunit S [Pirellula sp.]|jgi:type I restriction enzyme S subunit